MPGGGGHDPRGARCGCGSVPKLDGHTSALGDIDYQVFAPAESVSDEIGDEEAEARYARIHEQCGVLRYGSNSFFWSDSEVQKKEEPYKEHLDAIDPAYSVVRRPSAPMDAWLSVRSSLRCGTHLFRAMSVCTYRRYEERARRMTRALTGRRGNFESI